MNSKITYLAKSGYKGALWLAGLLILALLLGAGKLCFFLAVALAFWVFMFRNPERVALHISNNAVLAPIDGEIKQIQSNENSTKIVISTKILDVGVIRSPLNITEYKVDTIFGIPLCLAKAKDFFASKIVFDFFNGKMTLRPNLFHIYPLRLRSKNLERGERMGFMKAGEVELELYGAEIKLNVGDKVRGGESVLGYLQ